MSLYDVIDEISEKQILKTDTGDNRIFGVVIGIVAKNYDKDMPGRLCVTVPIRNKDANELKWAKMAMLSAGKKWGHYFMPEVGDQVLLVFEEGNIEKPYVIGCLNKDNDKFLTDSVDENNQKKRIVTKNGSSISFEDNKEGDGEKDKITVETAGQKHKILMDNENKKIVISDKKGENSITLNTSEDDGSLVVKVKKDIKIQVGDKIKVTMSGESGTVKVSADEFNVVASKGIKLKSDADVSFEGTNTKVKASASFKVESGGMVNISGTPIKLG